tara:strand:+ start:532 stop:720 length:189 start_codon:yes stop_codon:yes gene_type:complete
MNAKIKLVKKVNIAKTRAGLDIVSLFRITEAINNAKVVFCKPTSIPIVIALSSLETHSFEIK